VTQEPAEADQSAEAGRPALRGVVALLVLIESFVVLCYGVFLAVETVTAAATERVAAGFLAAITIGLAAGLAVAARSVARGRRAARAPVLTWQILQIAVAAPALSARWYIGVPLIVVAIVTGVGALRQDVLPVTR
jgi:hypothetical protein